MTYLRTFEQMGFHAGLNGGWPATGGMTLAQSQFFTAGFYKGDDVRRALEAM
jgi:hypothetical protein